MKILFALLLAYRSHAFLITKAEPGVVVVAPGDQVTLFCAVDDHYEWCKFYHPSGEFCDFEWKRSASNITMQECGLADRVEFYGKYDDKECGVRFRAEEGDTGVWRCEIEEYVTWRSRGAGRVQTAQMNVTVQASTTVPTIVTPLPTVGTVTSTKETTPIVTSTARTSTTELSMEKSELSTDTLELPTQPNKIVQNDGNKNEIPEAVPQIDEYENNKTGSSSSVLIGVFLVIIVIVVAVSGAFYYRKRMNSSTATAIYAREAKTSHDQTNMVRNSNSNISFHSNNAGRSNLHEYYPPDLTYSSITPESLA